MPDVCDGYSVGGDITNPDGDHLAIERSDGLKWAFTAGHLDPHGTLANAMVVETDEEVGLKATKVEPIFTLKLPNLCSAPNSTGHEWTFFDVQVADHAKVKIDPREVSDYAWMSRKRIVDMARVSLDQIQQGKPLAQWPRMCWEAAQIPLLDRLGWMDLTSREQSMLLEHCKIAPDKR